MKKWYSKLRKILSAITAAVVLFASCSGKSRHFGEEIF